MKKLLKHFLLEMIKKQKLGKQAEEFGNYTTSYNSHFSLFCRFMYFLSNLMEAQLLLLSDLLHRPARQVTKLNIWKIVHIHKKRDVMSASSQMIARLQKYACTSNKLPSRITLHKEEFFAG